MLTNYSPRPEVANCREKLERSGNALPYCTARGHSKRFWLRNAKKWSGTYVSQTTSSTTMGRPSRAAWQRMEGNHSRHFLGLEIVWPGRGKTFIFRHSPDPGHKQVRHHHRIVEKFFYSFSFSFAFFFSG